MNAGLIHPVSTGAIMARGTNLMMKLLCLALDRLTEIIVKKPTCDDTHWWMPNNVKGSFSERNEAVKMRTPTTSFPFPLHFTQSKCHRLSVPCAPDAMRSHPVVLRACDVDRISHSVCFFFFPPFAFFYSFVPSLSQIRAQSLSSVLVEISRLPSNKCLTLIPHLFGNGEHVRGPDEKRLLTGKKS